MLSFRSIEEVEALQAEVAAGKNPQEAKKLLAEEIVTRFHSAEAAAAAPQAAGNVLRMGDIPADVPDVDVVMESDEPIYLVAILNRAGLVRNSAAAKDVVTRRAVYIDGQPAIDGFSMKRGDSCVIQAGKKAIARVTLR